MPFISSIYFISAQFVIQISQQWNVIASEHVRYLKNRYNIKSLCWNTNHGNIIRGNQIYNSIVNIHITPKKSLLFLEVTPMDSGFELNNLPNSDNANETKV